MSSFLIRYSANIVPIERTTLADTTTTVDDVHSTIDKVLGSTITKDFGTAATEVIYDTYLTTTSGVVLSHSTILNTNPSVGFLFVKIVSAGSSGTPDCSIAIDAIPNYSIKLSGVGDFCVIPFDDNIYGITASGITIISSGAATVANIEILVGKL